MFRSYNPNSCRVFAEIHEKSRNNVADHTVPANILLTDKLEFIDYSYLSASRVIDISLSFSYQVNVA